LTGLVFVVPGAIDQLTGGYLFDRHVVDGLRALGRTVRVVELPGRFPDADALTRASAASALAGLASGTPVVIDGLALPGFADCLEREASRLRLFGFVHHPLSMETGSAPAQARGLALLEARLWPMLRGILCPSEHTAQAIVAAGVAADRVQVTPPGTEPPAIAPQPRPTPSGQWNLLAVGTVTPRKGHLLLIEALAGLRDIDWRLICIGSLERDRGAAAALRAAIAGHRLGDRITLEGELPHEELSAAYRAADLFTLPSWHEGYGMVFAEALAHGLPVIATHAGAIPATVPAAASLLVSPGDVAALRQALQRVFTDASLHARLAKGAVAAGRALPDWPTAVAGWAAGFDRLAK